MQPQYGWSPARMPGGSGDISGRHHRPRDYIVDRGHMNHGYARDRHDDRQHYYDDRRGHSRDRYDERGRHGRDFWRRERRARSEDRRDRGRRDRRREEPDGDDWGGWDGRRPAGGGYPGGGYPGGVPYSGDGWFSSASSDRFSQLSSAGLPSRAFLGPAATQARAFYQPYILRPSSVRSFSDETMSDSDEYLQQGRGRRLGPGSRCLCVLLSVILLAILATVIGVTVYFTRASYVSGDSSGIVDEADNTTTPAIGCGSQELECDNGGCIPSIALCDATNDCGDYSDEGSFCNSTVMGVVTFAYNYTADFADPTSQLYQNTTAELCGMLVAYFAADTFSVCDTIQFTEGSLEWHYITLLNNVSAFDTVQQTITTDSTEQTIFPSFAVVIDVATTAFDECGGIPCKNGGTCVPVDDNFYCICTAHFEDNLCRTPTDGASEEMSTVEMFTEQFTGTTVSTTTTTTLRPCVGEEMTCYNGYCFNASVVCDGVNDCGDWTDETVNCTENAAGTVTFELTFEEELADPESETYINATRILCEAVINALPDPTMVINCTTIAFQQGSVDWTYFLKLRNESVFEEVQSTIVDKSTAQVMFDSFAPVTVIETFLFTECDGNPCKLNSSCYDIEGTYHCLCEPGYWGRHCDQNDASCDATDDPCDEIGAITCINFGYEFYCPCNYGFTGKYCTTEINECDSNPCQNGGTCDDCFSGYNCICQDGTTGLHCETDLDDCDSNPCVNGVCVNDIGHFTCNCDAGWTGLTCEVDIDDCALEPCQNNATCVDQIDGYQCDCVCGYEGNDCESNIDECASSPCLNGATCIDLVDAYSCDCVPGYTGDECATDTDECASTPCQHGGTCVDGINEYTCVCGLDAVGTNCETEVDYGFDVTEDIPLSNLTVFETVGVSTSIAFHGTSYSQYTIMAGGFVTFNRTYNALTAGNYVYCGLDQGDVPTLSPYDDFHHPWYDNGGAIYYRETSNATLLARAQYDVCTLYPFYARGYANCTFTPTALSVVSWLNMWPGVDGVAKRDFQLVMASDGTQSYAIYLYKNISMDCASGCLRVTGYDDPAALLPDRFLLYSELQDTLNKGNDRIVYYMGTSADPCSSSPCTNGGVCQATDVGDYFCDCPINFTGQTCQLDTTPDFIFY